MKVYQKRGCLWRGDIITTLLSFIPFQDLLRHFVIFNRKILRMKEFERERRLRLRAYKKDQAEALAAAREAREAMDDDEWESHCIVEVNRETLGTQE